MLIWTRRSCLLSVCCPVCTALVLLITEWWLDLFASGKLKAIRSLTVTSVHSECTVQLLLKCSVITRKFNLKTLIHILLYFLYFISFRVVIKIQETFVLLLKYISNKHNMLSALEIYSMKKFPFPNKRCYPTKTGPINFDQEEIGNFKNDCSAFLIKLN